MRNEYSLWLGNIFPEASPTLNVCMCGYVQTDLPIVQPLNEKKSWLKKLIHLKTFEWTLDPTYLMVPHSMPLKWLCYDKSAQPSNMRNYL